MNGNHLPAGQPMPGGGVGGPAAVSGLNRGRRQPQPSYPTASPYTQPPHGLLFPGSFMNPYANSYYPPHQMAHHYQTGHMPNSPYAIHTFNPYPQSQRSPPAPVVHQTYPPIVSSSMQAHPQPYPRPPAPPQQQPSPALSTPPPFATVAPPPPAPIPQTPTSTHSSHAATTPLSPITPQPPTVEPSYPGADVLSSRVQKYPVPWLSHPDEPFPRQTNKSRRMRRTINITASVELPMSKQNMVTSDENASAPASQDSTIPETPNNKAIDTAASTSDVLTKIPVNSSSQPEPVQSTSSTPASPKAVPSSPSTPTKTNKSTTRSAVPAVPVIPAIPKVKDSKSPSNHSETVVAELTVSSQSPTEVAPARPEAETTPVQPAKTAPKLWSNLFQRPTPATTLSSSPNNPSAAPASAAPSSDTINVNNNLSGPGSFAKSNASSLAEALRDHQVSNGQKISFIEPRGLVNTGNMCYMNSVLQALIFCTPFYDFLDQVSKKVAHSFKSETPLIDAMVMFLREYKVIQSAATVDQLQKKLKSEELEQYGDSLTPGFVYDAVKRLPRFASMEHGHQQDAEEFLGFLLQAIDDECAHVMRHLDESSTAPAASPAASNGPPSPTSTNPEHEWLEVGRKQRAAITRSSGHSATPSPISKIFSGQQRSVVRVQGQKDSVTCEPYQPLQLDIGDAHVNNIMDALRHYTRSETLAEDFGSPRPDMRPPTKQVLIESVPPVLILHLKRFKFDPAVNGTIKLWTKIDYPLELELPGEIFSPLHKAALHAEGVGLKYRLTAVVYHHGKSASGGHYTVDLRRQDGREWIRIDDTVIRRIRSEEVAKSTLDGNTTKSAAWADQKNNAASSATGNRFDGIGDEDGGDEEGWNKVTSAGTGAKKWSSVLNANGSSNTAPAKNKSVKDSIKDNKVAYLLFYQKI
ncbi:cysteine proteinase [Nemania diffusa]|nr:cysteine proteinase [Nemania diffusa]